MTTSTTTPVSAEVGNSEAVAPTSVVEDMPSIAPEPTVARESNTTVSVEAVDTPTPPTREELAQRMRDKFQANRQEREQREGSVVEKIRALAPDDAEQASEEEHNPFAQPPSTAIPEPSAQFLNKVSPAAIPLPEPRGAQGAQGRATIPTPREPTTSPSAKRLGEIGKKLPGSEHIKVRRRDARSGQMQHIGDYSIRDIPQAMDFESFLSAYVRPTHGGGDFYLSGVDARGREMDAGIIRLADVNQPEEPQGNGMMDIMKMMMQREQDANQRMMNLMSNPRNADPIDQMHKVMGLKKEIEADVPSPDGPMGAMVHAMNAQSQQSMQMFMSMQQQAQQQQQQMMALLAAGRNETDPMMAMLLAKMDDKEKSSASAMPMPPPPPLPMGGLDLNTLLPTLLTALPAIVEMFRKEDPSVAVLKELVIAKQSDGISTRDVIDLLTNKTGTDDFKAAAENMSMMLNIQGMMQDRMGGGGGFFDSIGSALGSLFSNGNFAGSLADNIQASAEQKRLGVSEEDRSEFMALREKLMQERQSLQRERLLMDAERKRLAAAADQATAPKAPEPRPETQATSEEEEQQQGEPEQEAVARVKERTGGQLPEFPDELPEYLNRWLEGISTGLDEGGDLAITAVNDAKLAEGVVNTFVFLFQVPTWQPLVGRLFEAVKDANREESLAMIKAFIQAFEGIGALDPAVGDEAFRVMDEHFDAVVHTLRGFFGQAESMGAAADVAEGSEDVSDVSELYDTFDEDELDDEEEEKEGEEEEE